MRTGPDADCIFNRQNKYLPVAQISGVRVLLDALEDRSCQCIRHNNLKLGFLEASDSLIAAGLRSAPRATEALHF